ncbi:hypothetical protein ACFP7A_05630 [Sporolactobacillus kofuensis]|uniref:Polymer-forming cytoskeletal protein n=1 Tax=Sporolactobacillus kofuensis TaxID=269672 RepID=A0ABW1WES9_9BACL|nr:hypothetical protein [Sporolactobacillus kofuensis]MCO7175172.1 hypothetical protein [Sporolactobacillus kofuensis]
MRDSVQENLKIMGETHSNGGSFDKVRIMGECAISGSIEARSCKVMGECTVSGDLTSGYFRNMGEVTIDGMLTAKEARLIGETHVKGACTFKQASIYGELSAARDLSGEEIKVHGVLNVGANVSLERLMMRGGILVDGLLNCDQIDIVLKINAQNYVKEIGAGSVTIGKQHKIFGRAPLHLFHAESIEGDRLFLEYTQAKVVRGTDVVIGTGSKIERVEYSGTYKTSGPVEVGEVVQLTAHE